jgi:zinc protease
MHRTTLFLFLALILGFNAPALAAPAGKTQKIRELTLPNGLTVHEYTLANGLQLLLVPDASAPVFSFQVWFKVGSADEKMDPRLKRTGLAHLFEHMMFRGTPRYGDQKFDNALSAAGAADNNATTWLDRTNYYESLPKERLELVFDLESDRMANLALDEKLFKTELGAVFGELKMNKDKPTRVASNILWDTAFDVHPYKYTTMGTPDELNSFTVDDAKYFYKTYYAPNNATVIIVGDINVAKAVKLAEKFYGKYKSQQIPRPDAPVEPEQTKEREKRETHPLATNEIMLLAYKSPQLGHPDIAALELISAILAYGDGSLLEKSLVQTGLVAQTTAGANLLRNPSLFTLSNQLVNGVEVKKVRRIIEENIEKLTKGEISQQEIDRARNQYLLAQYNQISGNSELGDFLGESLVSSGDYRTGFNILTDIKKVTVADIQRVSSIYLKRERSTLVVLSPGKEKGN